MERLATRLKPPPNLSVSQWADRYRRLSPESSAEPGRWNTTRAEYQREIMDVMSDPRIERVVLMTSARVGKTQTLNNLLGFHIHQDPAPIMVVQPSLERGDEWVDDEFDPMVRDTPVLRSILGDRTRFRRVAERRRHRTFPGGRLYVVGANSPSGLAAKTVRVLLMDEVDRYDETAGKEGDPVSLAIRRTNTIWNRKIVLSSTPTIKGQSRIAVEFEASDKRRFWVPCPHCQVQQVLVWKQVRWPEDRPHEAMYHCDGCGVGWSDAERYTAVSKGHWRAEGPRGKVAGFHLNELYSPWRRLAETVADFLAARENPVRLKPWINTALGELWEDRHDVPAHEMLYLRRTPWPPGTLPPGVLFLEGSTDVQGNRLEWSVYGFDRDFGQYWIDGGVLEGDPAQPAVWLQHDKLLERRWRDAWGRDVAPESWGIDTGYLTQSVYAYALRHRMRSATAVLALDGRPKWRLPAVGVPTAQDVDYNGKKIGRVSIWPVGTWDLKSEIMSSLRLTEMGPGEGGVWQPGAMRFPDRLDIGFFQQITAEACVVVDTKPGYERREWRKLGPNEQLDLAVYARALARRDTYSFGDPEWEALTLQRGDPNRVREVEVAEMQQRIDPEPEPEGPASNGPVWGDAPNW